MGNHCTQAGLTNLGTLWDHVPIGGEVIITRDKITISDKARLDIGRSVVANEVKPSTYGQLMVSLSDLQYGDDSDAVLSPQIRVLPRKGMKDKCQTCNEPLKSSESKISATEVLIPGFSISDADTIPTQSKKSLKMTQNRKSVRDEFIPELTAAGVYNNTTNDKEELTFLTPETRSVDSGEYSAMCSNNMTDSLLQMPAMNTEGYDFLEVSPTTLFTTRSIAEENMRDLQNFLKQQVDSSASSVDRSLETKYDQKVTPPSSTKGEKNEDNVSLIRVQSVVRTESGKILSKKLATQFEQKGMRECHVYFTPRTSAEIWPPLVVTVGEEWDFVKVMRKAIANLQRSMMKGDRDGTHDWLFDYNPNKDIRRIKKDLKVLFGRKVVSFRDSHLKKSLKDVTSDFINKMWILQKDEDKAPKVRLRSHSDSNFRHRREAVRSPGKLTYAKSVGVTTKGNSKRKRYTRISNRV